MDRPSRHHKHRSTDDPKSPKPIVKVKKLSEATLKEEYKYRRSPSPPDHVTMLAGRDRGSHRDPRLRIDQTTTLGDRDRSSRLPSVHQPPPPPEHSTMLTGRDSPHYNHPSSHHRQSEHLIRLAHHDRKSSLTLVKRQPDHPRDNVHSDPPIPKTFRSTTNPPADAKTTLLTSLDQRMAARQTSYASLSHTEQQEQEQWAQDQLKQNSGRCIAGFAWRRIQGGYRCYGGSHMVTDELLAEGKGGFYCRGWGRSGKLKWDGPFYGPEELGPLVVVRDQMSEDRRRRSSAYGNGRGYGPR